MADVSEHEFEHDERVSGRMVGLDEWRAKPEVQRLRQQCLHVEGAWPRIAGWFGIDWTGPPTADVEWIEKETRFNPRGYGGKGVSRRKFTFVEWAKKDDTAKAWKEIAEIHDLQQKDLKDIDRVFGFLDGSVCRPAPLVFSTDKARKLGWHGFVDSSESILEVFDDLAKLKMIPPVPKVDVKFN